MRKEATFIKEAAVIIMLLALLGCSKASQLSVSEQLDLGNRYLAELNYEQAALTFKGVIEIEDRNVDAWQGYAQANVGLAESASPEDSGAYYHQAADAYEMVLELEPQRTEDYLELAELYEQMELPEEAAAVLERGLAQAEDPAAVQERLDAMRDIEGDLERFAQEQSFLYGEQYHGYLSVVKPEDGWYQFSYDFSEIPLGPLGYLIEDLDGDAQSELLVITASGEQTEEDSLSFVGNGYDIGCQVYEWNDGEITLADSVILQEEEMTLITLFSDSETIPGVFECYLYGDNQIGIEMEDIGGLVGDGSRSNFVSLRYDGSKITREGHAYYFGSDGEYNAAYMNTLRTLGITDASWNQIIDEGHAISEYVRDYQAVVRMQSVNLLSHEAFSEWVESGEEKTAVVELRFSDRNELQARTDEQRDLAEQRTNAQNERTQAVDFLGQPFSAVIEKLGSGYQMYSTDEMAFHCYYADQAVEFNLPIDFDVITKEDFDNAVENNVVNNSLPVVRLVAYSGNYPVYHSLIGEMTYEQVRDSMAAEGVTVPEPVWERNELTYEYSYVTAFDDSEGTFHFECEWETAPEEPMIRLTVWRNDD